MGIGCDQGMPAGGYHVHAHLAVYVKGKPFTIGSDSGHYYAKDCLYWLHAHDSIGIIHIEADRAEKARFFDRFLAKYASPTWQRPKSFYPRLDEVVVYRIEPERVTGKKGPLPPLGEQWPARNLTKSPGAVPPPARG